MSEPTLDDLKRARGQGLDTDALKFSGPRGDRSRHLSREALIAGIETAHAPRDEGTVDLLVARGPQHERNLPTRVLLTESGGLPGDSWGRQSEYGIDYQLATARTDFARLVANGQPLELHGDNLFLNLDLSTSNIPPGSVLRLGTAVVQVTPVEHNGCKKWVQRFGLAPMQLNLDPAYRDLRLRGIYLKVKQEGEVAVGDVVSVLQRP
jgi:hypothetical protein